MRDVQMRISARDWAFVLVLAAVGEPDAGSGGGRRKERMWCSSSGGRELIEAGGRGDMLIGTIRAERGQLMAQGRCGEDERRRTVNRSARKSGEMQGILWAALAG
jgi:hypothetical protein